MQHRARAWARARASGDARGPRLRVVYELILAPALALALNYSVIDSAIICFFRSRVSAVSYLVRVFRFGCRYRKIPYPNLVLKA